MVMENLCGGDAAKATTESDKKEVADIAKPDTLLKTFLGLCEKHAAKRLMTQPMGGGADNLKYWTFGETLVESKKMAAYLKSLELEPGSKIAICSKNCAWWIMADIAAMMAGLVTVPVYPTLTEDTVSYILEHSESKLVFVGKLDEKPWEEMKKGVPDDTPVVSFPLSPKAEGCPCLSSDKCKKWDDIIEANEPIDEIADRKPEEIATIIYTSGSTGRPKGVMHDFKTCFESTKGMCSVVEPSPSDTYLSYLPLAHGMERWLGMFGMMFGGTELFFADSLETFVQDLNRAHPTLFVSVPRLWTKFQQGVFKKMPPKKLDTLMSIPIVSMLVRKKILKGLGLDRVRLAGSGSAPIPKELIQWYRRLGLELLEGYGMTENMNYSHISKKGRSRPGYVGEPYPGVEQRIADDGEIQLKTPGLMVGYYKNEEATKEVITEDGWFRTGDRGEIDSMGRLKITGRTKEIFKTSKGKYVAPAPIENKLINHPKIEIACVGGANHPQPMAVIRLSEDATKEAAESEEKREEIAKVLEEHVTEVNGTLDGHEHMQFVVVVKEEWLPENGFLTPTQKIVRRKIEEAYSGNNDEWYGAKKKVIWHGW
uniref:AMP-dependent synthetase/ligase domain-containing protein n=1 Tax=Pseudictyota dubia TaxID=2749911 RepID=A0A7R9VNL5_9STRA|eukprot:CAMPEP_0197440822 /NCGR_PEP_ID=MMETSP1175-20131217/7228_1 /TAXON_ID=1003142 /ORGANISM="Triceratium dubium, Strain CCMP147" /LENGTH=595 /DNA_ID=CAMNT_0042970995 /DNA_START=123 /DNA_END=1910 /DNA_ORIENTATION=+